MKYFEKIAGKNWKKEGLKGFGFGAAAGLVHAAVTHPIEHKLYGKGTGMGFWKHFAFRGVKSGLATGASLGTFHFLNTVSKRRKSRSKRVNNRLKWMHKKKGLKFKTYKPKKYK